MLKAVHREKVLREKDEGIRIGQRSWKKGSKDIWITEPFHGQFFKNTEEVRDKTSWQCMAKKKKVKNRDRRLNHGSARSNSEEKKV